MQASWVRCKPQTELRGCADPDATAYERGIKVLRQTFIVPSRSGSQACPLKAEVCTGLPVTPCQLNQNRYDLGEL